MSYLVIGARVLLLGVFVVALAGKLRRRAAFDEFRRSIAELRVLPRNWSLAAALAVTAAEAAIIVLLGLPYTVLPGFGLAAVLLVVFTTGIVLALRRGQRAPCRCFGASAAPLGPAHVVRNLILTAAGVTGLIAAFAAGTAGVQPGGIAVTLAAAAVGVLIVVRLDDLVALFAASVPTR
jgi:hypothetical protein